jgi:hypothetical protein
MKKLFSVLILIAVSSCSEQNDTTSEFEPLISETLNFECINSDIHEEWRSVGIDERSAGEGSVHISVEPFYISGSNRVGVTYDGSRFFSGELGM